MQCMVTVVVAVVAHQGTQVLGDPDMVKLNLKMRQLMLMVMTPKMIWMLMTPRITMAVREIMRNRKNLVMRTKKTLMCNLKLMRLLKTLFNLRKMLNTDQECMDHLVRTQEVLMEEACTQVDHQEPHLTHQHQGHTHPQKGLHQSQLLQLGHLHLLDPSLLQDQLTIRAEIHSSMAQVMFLRPLQDHLRDQPQVHQNQRHLIKNPLSQRHQNQAD